MGLLILDSAPSPVTGTGSATFAGMTGTAAGTVLDRARRAAFTLAPPAGIIFTIKQGDLEPGPQVALRDVTGAVVDLSSVTGVALRLANSQHTELWMHDAVIIDVAGGVIAYTWQTGETDVAGFYYAEFVVTWAGARPQTYPANGYLQIVIEPRL